MRGQALDVTWYRFRATFARRRGGYLALIILIGLIGGIAMASIAAGRRTQASYPTFLASTNPSDLTVSIYSPNSGGAVTPLTARIARLRDVKAVEAVAEPHLVPLTKDGAPRLSDVAAVNVLGSVDGMFLDQDRLAIAQGRRSDPNRIADVVMDSSAARLLGVHVDETVAMGLYTDAQTQLPGFGTPSVPPRLRIAAKVVGIAVVNNQVVEDDVDRAYGFVFVTPALMREAITLSPAQGAPIAYGLQLNHGTRDIVTVEQEIIHLVPPGATSEFHVTSRVVTQVELAIKPESVALGGFGIIAALVCLVLGTQAISRQLRWGDEDRQVLRALGAGRVTTAGDGLIGILGAVTLGSLVAVGLAVGLSPLAPLGPVRPVYPYPGIAVDWTVLGIGLAVLIGVLGALSVALAYRVARQRIPGRLEAGDRQGSGVVTAAVRAG